MADHTQTHNEDSYKFWTILRSFSRRAFVFYAFLYLVSGGVVDYKKFQDGFKVRKLNMIVPSSFDYLLEISNDPSSVEVERMKEYLRYYQAVIEFFPHISESYALLGFCYYQVGDYDKAIVLLKEAVRRKPEVFWYRYNLGVLYGKLGEEGLSLTELQSSQRLNFETTLRHILSSKVIYRNLLLHVSEKNTMILKGLNEGKIEAAHLVNILQMSKSKEDLILKEFRAVRLRLF